MGRIGNKGRRVILRITVALFVMLVIIIAFIVQRYTPTKAQMDLTEYYGTHEVTKTPVIIDEQIVDSDFFIEEDTVYLLADTVSGMVNDEFYYDEGNGQMLYTTPTSVAEIQADTMSVVIDDETYESATALLLFKDSTPYLNMEFVKAYTDIEYHTEASPDRLVIDAVWTDVQTATAKKEAQVRYKAGIKSPILVTLESGTAVRVLDKLDSWYQVRTESGVLGYVDQKQITSPQEEVYDRSFTAPEFTNISLDTPVIMAWHQVTNPDGNAAFAQTVEQAQGLNVISPTWFSVLNNQGEISSLVSADYVAQAHQRGIQVWGLIDNFSTDVDTQVLLASTQARNAIITALMAQAQANDLDGINLDFESIPEEAGTDFVQFVRELSAACRTNGLVFSIDNLVPASFTEHYAREVQGKVADYVVVMGYDEYYSGSESAGSVASLSWAEEGLANTIAAVPKEKVIFGIPFYTRLWKTTSGVLTSEAISMSRAAELISDKQDVTFFDSDAGQNYAEWEDGSDFYQVWMEDETSVKERVDLAQEYEAAGIGAWKIGLETDGVWSIITDTMAD
ncbi:MAG: glycosyl hydrolase family 18 protein [Lachnospiraceae bacterium]